jgi:hypothetical protein
MYIQGKRILTLLDPATMPVQAREPRSADSNKLRQEDRAGHAWYRFVLSFPPHLVRGYLERFELSREHTVLDPFCGTGTTLVECKKLGIPSVGIEANPMACFASRVKTDWRPDPRGLRRHALRIAEEAHAELASQGLADEALPLLQHRPCGERNGKPLRFRTLSEASDQLVLGDSISPLPLHKSLVLLDVIRRLKDARFEEHELLAFAKAVVFSVSNLHFGPEVGVGPKKQDAEVIDPWLHEVETINKDLTQLSAGAVVPALVHQGDARILGPCLEPGSIDAVITSPPYPNEKDYTRTTRLESVLLGLVQDKAALRGLKKHLIRSNTRGVYKADRDDALVADHAEIQRIARAIEQRRIQLKKTSGFERLYARVTKLYFGGMKRHLAVLRTYLRPGARLAYVVGDQASYLRVMIRTGQLLAGIAESLGYELEGIDLFRTRLATATREQLREEVVLLRWPG